MKTRIYFMIWAMLLFLAAACKKEGLKPSSNASVYVINGVVDAGAVKVKGAANNTFTYAKASDLGFASGNVYGFFVGSNPIRIVQAADTTKTLFDKTMDLPAISTLYLSGRYPNVDTMYRVEKNLPLASNLLVNTDYSFYLRFVNLVPNSPAVNVRISTNTAASNDFTGITYKGITDFKKYVAALSKPAIPATTTTPAVPAVPATPNYTFEVHDPVTDAIIASATVLLPIGSVNSTRFKTVSIVFKGLIGGTGANAPGVFQVNYN